MLFPRAGGWKRTTPLLIVALFAVSCGPSAGVVAPTVSATKIVRGPGFRFTAPAGWRVAHSPTSATARSPGATALVSAEVYRLGRPYSPDQFAAAAKELDGVAAKLALAAGGEVTASETIVVAGRKVRAYRFTATSSGSGPAADRVGFVLAGKREVQLLCQAPAGGGDVDGACGLLFDTFSLTP